MKRFIRKNFTFRKCCCVFKSACLCLTMIALMASTAVANPGNKKIRVMTRNLYLGADIFKVVDAALAAQANPDDPNSPYLIPLAVEDVYETMQETNFPERAEAIADEIALFEPDVVGLQEVSTFYIQTPSDYISGNPEPASTVVIDFYQVLNAALKARGMNYTAYKVDNADIEMPMVDYSSSNYLSDLRMVDHDVILVRKDHDASIMMKGKYQDQLSMDLGGTSVAFNRGYIAVDVDIKGNVFLFVNTHLEIDSDPGSIFRVVQSAQMLELLNKLSSEENIPVILVGDLNSSPDQDPGKADVPGIEEPVPYIPPYMLAEAFGYIDSWEEQKRYDEGYTCCFDEYLSDPDGELTARYDHIFVDPKDLEIDKVQSDVVGDMVDDMTPSGLWPSDHAGVISTIKFKSTAHGKPN